MRARARIAARGDRWVTRHGEPPLTVRCRGQVAHLVGSAAGPLGGDRLGIEVDVHDGADVIVRSVAAQLVLPGPHGDRSRLDVRAQIGPTSRLAWEPQPMVVVAGARHESRAVVSLTGDARVSWREELVLGRHGEPAGSVDTSLRIELDGEPVIHHVLRVGPDAGRGWDGPAGTGGHRAVGTLAVVEPVRWAAGPPPAADVGCCGALLPTDGPAVIVVALGAPPQVTATLDQALAALSSRGCPSADADDSCTSSSAPGSASGVPPPQAASGGHHR